MNLNIDTNPSDADNPKGHQEVRLNISTQTCSPQSLNSPPKIPGDIHAQMPFPLSTCWAYSVPFIIRTGDYEHPSLSSHFSCTDHRSLSLMPRLKIEIGHHPVSTEGAGATTSRIYTFISSPSFHWATLRLACVVFGNVSRSFTYTRAYLTLSDWQFIDHILILPGSSSFTDRDRIILTPFRKRMMTRSATTSSPSFHSTAPHLTCVCSAFFVSLAQFVYIRQGHPCIRDIHVLSNYSARGSHEIRYVYFVLHFCGVDVRRVFFLGASGPFRASILFCIVSFIFSVEGKLCVEFYFVQSAPFSLSNSNCASGPFRAYSTPLD